MKPRTFGELFDQAERHEDYWTAGVILEFTESVVREMERQAITRTELATRIGTTPAYVTKILRGKANFTLATMVRLARALDAELRVHLVAAVARRPARQAIAVELGASLGRPARAPRAATAGKRSVAQPVRGGAAERDRRL
jgi:transcriptional regulator with XRE-family HTH domain